MVSNHINNYIYTSPAGFMLDNNDVFNYIQDNAKLYGGEIGFSTSSARLVALRNEFWNRNR
jgi:hypothetical protein